MGRAIPPEWTVNLLALGKEPSRFKDLEDQLNMYRQQWQAYWQKHIIAKMAGKTRMEKEKIMKETIIIIMVYDDQDDRHILKTARKQQYIMFPDPIAFLKDELKATNK
jgi:2-succinyl-5-enolpyruvyl-6-hydroxy-3-cyclohexene-1-carboxylate synthase